MSVKLLMCYEAAQNEHVVIVDEELDMQTVAICLTERHDVPYIQLLDIRKAKRREVKQLPHVLNS